MVSGLYCLLFWILHGGELILTIVDFIPIPGTKRVKYLEENAQAVNVTLSKEEESKIRKAIDSVGGSKGSRYPPMITATCFGDSPELDA